jgi:hypothetical protein
MKKRINPIINQQGWALVTHPDLDIPAWVRFNSAEFETNAGGDLVGYQFRGVNRTISEDGMARWHWTDIATITYTIERPLHHHTEHDEIAVYDFEKMTWTNRREDQLREEAIK